MRIREVARAIVIAGLDPAIHTGGAGENWIIGSSPMMTTGKSRTASVIAGPDPAIQSFQPRKELDHPIKSDDDERMAR